MRDLLTAFDRPQEGNRTAAAVRPVMPATSAKG
jgi:hypothetical protein